jgi:DNA-binding MarR family transcriptional regulator
VSQPHRTADVLHSAALHLLRRAARADAGMNLDGPRASLLSILVFAGPQPMSKLAQWERVTPAAITKLVGALERGGLAIRVRDEGDRRVVRVVATEQGRALLQEGRAARLRVVTALLRGLPPGDLETLRRAAALIEELLAAEQDATLRPLSRPAKAAGKIGGGRDRGAA